MNTLFEEVILEIMDKRTFPEICVIRNNYIDKEYVSCMVTHLDDTIESMIDDDEYPEQVPPTGRTAKAHNNILKMNKRKFR